MVRLIIAVVCFIVAGAAFALYTRPAYDQVQALQAQIASYNAALDKAAELQQLKQSLLSRFNAFNPSDLDRLQRLLPDHVDNVRLILDLDNLASRYGLSLQNVDVSSSEAENAKKQTAIGAIGTANQKYDSLTLTFTTRGTYENFIPFITDLESSLRIVDLASLSMAAENRGDSSGRGGAGTQGASGDPAYTYRITLRTYWLK